MVRRRQRSTKTAVAVAASTVKHFENGKSYANMHGLLDEKYFCSPKRKECKIDSTTTTTTTTIEYAAIDVDKAKITASKSKQERANERVIGVPLATRSQTRTIEHFFKANAKLKAQEQQQHAEQLKNGNAYFYDLGEEDDTTNDTDNTECSDETNLPYEYQQCSTSNGLQSNNNIYATCENIFLQEPVLKLKVEQNLPYMPLSKGLELEPIFSSPSSMNGRFNKLVSISAQVANTLPDNDNSSCDSGVAFSAYSLGNNSPPHAATSIMSPLPSVSNINRRRKPTTPHRIVCPSPAKSMPVLVTHKLINEHAGLSPRKSHRQHVVGLTTSPSVHANSNKTRRRLNHQHQPHNHQEATMHATQETSIIATNKCINMQNEQNIVQIDIVSSDDDDDDDNQSQQKQAQPPPKQEDEKKDITITSTYTSTDAADTAKIDCKALLSYSIQPKIANCEPTAIIATNKKDVKSNKTQIKAANKLPLINGRNRELSEIYPVRRSVRKTKTVVKEEMMRTLEQAILEERCDGLCVQNFKEKGRGVITTRVFQRGEFVVEYVGDLISMSEAAEREQRYALDENAGCYMYYFKHKNQQYCIDATKDTGKFGRLINHSRNGNLMTKVVVVKQRPHLILMAKDNIAAGEELCYDYGDRSKESLLHHPWLAF